MQRREITLHQGPACSYLTGTRVPGDPSSDGCSRCGRGGATCSVPPGGSWHEVTLRCPFPGRMCNINIDECASNPCHNGGTCKDGINGFTCLCPEGFHDPKCLSEVNECNSNPCIHGRCHDGLNG